MGELGSGMDELGSRGVNWELGGVNWEVKGGELGSWRGNHMTIEPLLVGIRRETR